MNSNESSQALRDPLQITFVILNRFWSLSKNIFTILWFDYWTLKEWKTTKVQNHSVAAYYLFTQMIGHFLICLLLQCLYFFWEIHNMCKPRTITYPLRQPGPPGLVFYGSGLHAYQAGWRWWIQAGSVSCDQKFSCKWNLSFFKTVPPNRLHFYLDSPLHRISSLFSYFCLFKKVILQKILKLRFWKFKLVFLRMQFSLIATLFALVLVICLSWFLHLKLSQEFLTLVSFNIWR